MTCHGTRKISKHVTKGIFERYTVTPKLRVLLVESEETPRMTIFLSRIQVTIDTGPSGELLVAYAALVVPLSSIVRFPTTSAIVRDILPSLLVPPRPTHTGTELDNGQKQL
jgi:hypothetical protein